MGGNPTYLAQMMTSAFLRQCEKGMVQKICFSTYEVVMGAFDVHEYKEESCKESFRFIFMHEDSHC